MDKFFSMTPAELAAIPITIASGTPTPVYESAAVTSVITAEQIKAMGATELHEILETVPGVHANLQEITNDYHYTIRGINNATNSQTLILLDGTRAITPLRGTFSLGLEMPVDAIQRVEVIRGPGSALYGADAFAGVINIVTKKTKDINGTRLGIRAGNWDTQSAWGQFGKQWAGWDIAASLQYQHSEGDKGRIVNSDAQTLFDKAFETQASYAPSPMDTRYKIFNSHVTMQRKHWNLGFWAVGSPDIGVRSGAASALDPLGSADGEQYLGDIRFSTEDLIENWEFRVHGSYLHSDIHARVHTFPANAMLPIDAIGNVNSLIPVTSATFSRGTIDDIGQVQRIPTIELSSLYSGWNGHLLQATAGFRYEEITADHRTNYGAGVINPAVLPTVVNGDLTDVTGTAFAYIKDKNRSIWSLAVQDEWQFAEDWHLTAGFRYDDYSDFGNTVNPRAALVWNITDQLTSKIMYGEAFRPPTFTEQSTQNNPVLLGNPNLNPETIDTIEWAIDYRPFSSLRAAANIYYYHIENLIVAVPDIGSTTSTYQNQGDQSGYGGELEWDWQIQQQLNLKGNYAWQNARSDMTHSRVAGVPEHHVYFAANWQFIPNWRLQSQLNWIGGRTRLNQDSHPLKDYQTFDFTLTGKKLFGYIDCAASLRNAFDAKLREPAAISLPENLPLPGRSFYFEASVHF